MKPFISVIIPSYNYEIYLKKCIDSVLNQDYKNFEIIVVDDCSKDSSRDLILSYGDQVIPVFPDENGGHAQAFNLGFSHSKGDIIAFLDADDFANSGWLTALASCYEDNVVMYHYSSNLVDESDNVIGNFPCLNKGLDFGDLSEKLRALGRIRTTVTSGLAFTRKALLQVMPIDKERYSQGADGYLVSTVPLYGSVKILEGNLTSYRQHSRSHSKFQYALVKRAEWCYRHNIERYFDIKKASLKLNVPYAETFGTKDILFLEQLMVLTLFPSNVCLEKQHSLNRRQIYSLAVSESGEHYVNQPKWLKWWWFCCAYAPEIIAKVLLKWKLQANSRPRWLTTLKFLFKS